MVKCKLCGKVVRTTQGLRGHMTFIHGLYANHNNPAAELTFRQRIDENRSLVKSESNTELLTELRRTVRALQNRLAVMDTRSEANRIATKVELLSERLDEHDRWFNPHDIDEIILRISGGPIADLEKRLDDLQLVIKPGRRG